MPGLISLKTDLKDLKYDSMPLGSDAPYVTKDINKPPSSNGTSMQITKRVDDLARIGKMLTHKPGIKYLTNEALLQQEDLNKKISQAKGKGIKALATDVLRQAGKTAIGTVKIIGSTLAQVPVNGTGTHFVKGFKTDTYLQPIGGNTRTSFAQFFGAGGIEGAPLALQGKPIPTGVRGLKETTPEPGTIPGSITNQTTGTITTEDSSRQSIYSGSKTYTGTTTENNIRTITNPASGANIYKSRIFVNSGSIANLPEDSTVTIADYLGNFNKGDQATINENAVQYPVDLATFNKDSGSFVNQSTYKKDLKIIDFRSGSLSTYSFNYQAPKIRKDSA